MLLMRRALCRLASFVQRLAAIFIALSSLTIGQVGPLNDAERNVLWGQVRENALPNKPGCCYKRGFPNTTAHPHGRLL